MNSPGVFSGAEAVIVFSAGTLSPTWAMKSSKGLTYFLVMVTLTYFCRMLPPLVTTGSSLPASSPITEGFPLVSQTA